MKPSIQMSLKLGLHNHNSTVTSIRPPSFYRVQGLERIVGVTVRREKALDFSGCVSRPGTGSLHPVAIEAAAEATKLSELSV
jgi:hypothetical protein